MFENPTPTHISLGRMLLVGALIILGTQITARAQPSLYELRTDNVIYRVPGTACSNNTTCPDWTPIDKPQDIKMIVAGIGGLIYQLRNDGTIWRSKGGALSACSSSCWELLDKDTKATAIAAGGSLLLYKSRKDSTTTSIWTFTDPPTPCKETDASCSGWTMIDNTPDITAIVAGPGASNKLFKLKKNVGIWSYDGVPCSGSSCPGWQRIDNNTHTETMAVGGYVVKLHNNGSIWQYLGTPCTADSSCLGWTKLLDAIPNVKAIAVYGLYIYHLRNNGKVYRYPCVSAEGCMGWQLLNNDPDTTAMVAGAPGANLLPGLYLLGTSGKVWRFTGTPCSGNSCTGWLLLDNKPETKVIVAN